MSVGPLAGLPASAAGSPLAQTRGSEVDRAAADNAAFQKSVASQERAEQAAGIGATDGQEHDTQERDADGRRLWEVELDPQGRERGQVEASSGEGQARKSKDATGESGNHLDLSG